MATLDIWIGSLEARLDSVDFRGLLLLGPAPVGELARAVPVVGEAGRFEWRESAHRGSRDAGREPVRLGAREVIERCRRAITEGHAAAVVCLERGATLRLEAGGGGAPGRLLRLPASGWPEETIPYRATGGKTGAATPGRAFALDPDAPGAPALLQAIGIMTADGRLRRDERRKLHQIDHFVRLVEPALVGRAPAGADRAEPITVVDCGCGKSQLLFVLNHYIRDVLGRRSELVGLDEDPAAIAKAAAVAQRLGYRNMAFFTTAIRDWAPPRPIDLVLSLHACDTATDEAIALGVNAGAHGIIAVPCCQHELAGQTEHAALRPVLAHPVLRQRFADLLTDGLRAVVLEACGYRVDVLEYVSPLDSPKNIMLRAVRWAAGAPDHAGAVGRRAVALREYRLLREEFGLRSTLTRLLTDRLSGDSRGDRSARV